jgi:aminoglycoside phosphotransferase (APT) family kinase protein
MNPDTIHNQLLQLLKQTFGTKVEIVDQKIGNQHHDYLVLLIQLRRPSIKIVIKIAGPEAPMAISFERTAMLHHLVATHTSITMPEILAVNMSCQIWPWRYLIKTYTPGQEWIYVRQQMNTEELSNAYQQIGSAVAQLHTIQFIKFGELEVDGRVHGNKPFLIAFTERAQCSIKSEHLRDLFFSALDTQRHLFLDIRQARLCHEDLHGYNILFQHRQGQWNLATILDFDKAWSGHHEIDLARLEFWRGMTSDEFWRSYKAICPVEALYEQRRQIYQLLWCFEYAQSTPEHLRDTQYLCAQLGLPCPDRFE